RDQGVAVGGVEVVLQQQDVRPAGGPQPQPFGLTRAPVGVDGLDHQHRSFVGREGPGERLDQPDGVLPLRGAQVVEGEEEQGRVRRAQVGGGARGFGSALWQWWGDDADGYGGAGGDRVTYEVGGDPHLVDDVEPVVLGGGEVLDLPVPHADPVGPGENVR